MDTYSSNTLLQVMQTLHTPSTFWLNLAFPGQINFDTETIDFDKIKGGRRIAPFVAPTAQGKVMRDKGYNTTSFQAAYIKPKHIVDPSRLLKRRAGENYAGSMTPKARHDAIVTDIMQEQKDMIWRRWELMAAEAIMEGKVTVVGEDYPEVVVDFGRDPSQNITLTGTALWTDSASKPYKDIESWSVQTSRLSGFAIRDWILGGDVWEALIDHPDTAKLLDRNISNGEHSLKAGPGNIPDDGAIVELKGTIGAGIRIWTYADIYEDDNGNPVEIMDPGVMIGINPTGVQGVRCFGAIMDAKSGYRPQDIFTKHWENDDPSVEYVMSQSAPLMVPKNANATMKIRPV